MHIVGPLAIYPYRETRSLMPPEATWEDYRATSKAVGLERCVIVQPSFFAFDNSCTLDSVERFEGRARAVVVVDRDVTATILREMHKRGARGTRLQSVVAGGLGLDALEEISQRIAPLGWHLQLYLDACNLPDFADRLNKLPVDIVFDHMAHIDKDSTIHQPGFNVLLDLLENGKTWVKLSNAQFPPSAERARRLIAARPDRMLWGSDWPHVAYRAVPPDEGELLDALESWAPDETIRHQILVTNPDQLYFRAR